jgi:hypothetical protein
VTVWVAALTDIDALGLRAWRVAAFAGNEEKWVMDRQYSTDFLWAETEDAVRLKLAEHRSALGAALLGNTYDR